VFITTGSKELNPYLAVDNYQDRLYLRVLPAPEAIDKCLSLGFKSSHLICMQGPFSEKMNAAMLEHTRARYLVTKDTGKSGGLPEKLSAAQNANIKVLLISRPGTETGLTLAEACNFFKNKFNGE